jgi:Domain of unknown function (DUF1772)
VEGNSRYLFCLVVGEVMWRYAHIIHGDAGRFSVSEARGNVSMRSIGRNSQGRSVVASTLLVVTCLVLGLLAGGMLVIGVSLVSFWKSLSPSDFQAWFVAHSHLVGRLMIPLGVGAIAVTVAAVGACWRGAEEARRWLLIAAVAAMGVMVTYPLFFEAANAAFARGGLSDAAARSLLDRWATWHWIRTGLGTVGFAAALRALQGGAGTRVPPA